MGLKDTFLYKKIYLPVRKFPRKMAGKYHRYYTLRKLYPSIYEEYAKQPVKEDKVVFIELRQPKLSNSFQVLYDALKNKYDFDIHEHYLRTSFVTRKEHVERCKAMIADIADAKYVFLNEASNVVSCVPLRKETVLTQLWHGCGAFKKFGMSTADMIFGDNRKNMLKYPFNKNYSHVTVSSEEVIWAYEEAMNIEKGSGIVKPLGSSRTDVFFDKNFVQMAYDKLYGLMPQSVGKKVILFAPTFRGRVASATSPDCFDIEQFKEKLSDDYVLICKHHPLVRKRPEIPNSCKEFAVDFTDTMSIEELICVSDICISDYSSLVFEYSLFERPMLFFAYDLDEYFDWRGFYYDYYDLTPGPICKTNEEMIDYIEHIDERFDKEQVVAFKEKFMSACDGHATERILETAMGKDVLEKHYYGLARFQDDIKVSVVMPIYNCEKYLAQCLDSIVRQTLREIEIICVDDGSTDGTMAILEEYAKKDDRIQIIKQANQYAGVARNNGLKHAKGKYVVFWDGDDFFHPEALYKLYEQAERTSADIVVCGAYKYNNSTHMTTTAGTYTYLKRKYLPEQEVFSKKDLPEYIFNFTANVPWNKLYKRQFVLDNQLFFQNSRSYNDMFFVMDALYKAERISTVIDKLVYYRVELESSLTGKASVSPLCVIEQYDLVREHLALEQESNEIKCSFANAAFRAFLYALDIQKKKESYIELYNVFKTQYKDRFFVKDELGYYYVDHMDEWEHKYETSEPMDFLLYRSWYYKQYGMDEHGAFVKEKENRKELRAVSKELARTTHQLDVTLKSRTYRLGKIVNFVPHKIMCLLKGE